MTQELLSVEEIAMRLKLHVKTVRGYVRSGRLKATRIGKQYRIRASDFIEFAGASNDAAEQMFTRLTGIEVSSVVQVDGITAEAAYRLTTLLLGAANGAHSNGAALRVSTAYDTENDKLIITASGDIDSTTQVLGLVKALSPVS
jgi:excisionase family DNA binding protein